MYQPTTLDNDRVLLEVRVAISETLGLLEDDGWMKPEATLDGELGITTFELEQIVCRIESKLGIRIEADKITECLKGPDAPNLSDSFTVGALAAAVATCLVTTLS